MTPTSEVPLTIVIPTYCREQVLLDSVRALLALKCRPAELLVVDQTPSHEIEVEQQLRIWDSEGSIRHIKLSRPSIPHAMNIGLQQAFSETVLFLDDDIIPDRNLICAHLKAQSKAGLVAGQVLQPGECSLRLLEGEEFRFNSDEPAWISEFIGCNFSVNRAIAMQIGGFDENFVGAAYRYEAEFAYRYVQVFGPLYFEPLALISHLRLPAGGTRAHGHHLSTPRPSHSVGAYYELLQTRRAGWLRQMLRRPLRAVRTRFHLQRPWRIPVTLLAEVRGLLLALKLHQRGAKLVVNHVRRTE